MPGFQLGFGLGLTANTGGGGAVQSRLPMNARMGIIGDSILARHLIKNSANSRYFSGQGHLFHLLKLARNKIRQTYAGSQALSGATPTDVINTQIPALPTNLDVVVGEIGTNVLTSWTLAQLESGFDTAAANTRSRCPSARLWWCGLPPLFAPNALTAPQEQNRLDYNAYIKAYCLANPTLATYSDPDLAGLVSGDYADGIHFVTSGALKYGTVFYSAVSSQLPSGNLRDAATGDTVINLNPLLTGGATIATGYALDASQSGGATVVASKASGDKQQIAISGTKSGTSKYFDFTRYTTVAAEGFTPTAGRLYEICIDVDVTSPVGISEITVQTGIGTAAFASIQFSSVGTQFDDAVLSGSNVVRSPPVPMAAGVPNYLDVVLRVCLADSASAVSGTLVINKLWLQEVVE